MTTDIRSFLRIIRLVVNQSTVPVMEFHERVIFLSSAVLCKSMWCYYSLCKIHRDDTFIICQLMCVTDFWAHMSLVHSILSLKLGVTMLPLKDQPKSGETGPRFHWRPRPRHRRRGRRRNTSIQPEYAKAAGGPFGRRLHAYFLTISYWCLPVTATRSRTCCILSFNV